MKWNWMAYYITAFLCGVGAWALSLAVVRRLGIGHYWATPYVLGAGFGALGLWLARRIPEPSDTVDPSRK